jgi:hypothetical protein
MALGSFQFLGEGSDCSGNVTVFLGNVLDAVGNAMDFWGNVIDLG